MKKRIGIIGVLVAILALGIGYAVIDATVLNVTGDGTIVADPDNFDVHFKESEEVEKTGPAGATLTAAHTGPTTATIKVENFTKKDDEATFVYTIENSSADLKADLEVGTIVNSNSEYFTIDAVLGKAKLNAAGDTTTLTVTVTAIKTPIAADQTTNITVPVTATPVHA